MRLAYICNSGGRRSAALAAYTAHFSKEYDIDSLEVVRGAMKDEKRERQFKKRPARLERCERTRFYDYNDEISMLRRTESNIHPRFGVLLLREGIYEVLEQKASRITPEFLQQADLVLTVNREMRDKLRRLCHPSEKIHTVSEFTGATEFGLDIDDINVYVLPLIDVQLWEDRVLCDVLRTYSHKVLEKLSKSQTSDKNK